MWWVLVGTTKLNNQCKVKLIVQISIVCFCAYIEMGIECLRWWPHESSCNINVHLENLSSFSFSFFLSFKKKKIIKENLSSCFVWLADNVHFF